MEPFLELDSNTVITKAEVTSIGTTLLHVEKTTDNGKVKKGTCAIPGYKWTLKEGFSEEEIAVINAMIKENELLVFSHVII